MYIWQKLGLGFLAAGALAGAIMYARDPSSGPADGFAYGLGAVFCGWSGALVGGFLDWARHRRSPFEPIFEGRFLWHYRQRYWARFALDFSAGWVAFVLMAALVALISGETSEAGAFFSVKGALLVVLFMVVFAVEGAVIGVLVDFVRLLSGKDGQKH